MKKESKHRKDGWAYRSHGVLISVMFHQKFDFMKAYMPLLYINHKNAYFLLSNLVIFTDFIAMFLALPMPS